MRIIVDIEGNQLVIEPETKLEKDCMKRYFGHSENEKLKVAVLDSGEMRVSMCERAKRNGKDVEINPH